MGLDRLTVGGLGLRESEDFGLGGWLREESTSVTLDQLISHVPRGPRTSLRWRSTSNSPSAHQRRQ